LWENTETKNISLSSSLELVKVGGYDFPHPCVGLQNNHFFFKWPLADTDFDGHGWMLVWDGQNGVTKGVFVAYTYAYRIHN
jgi:hypothetical protein